MLNEDLLRSFPKLLRNEISVHVIQSRGHILNTYDEALSIYAEKRLAHDQVEVLTNARVKEVKSDRILFSQKDETGKVIEKEIPHGFCLWSTGVGRLIMRKSRYFQLLTHMQRKQTSRKRSHLKSKHKLTDTLSKLTPIFV